MNGYEFEKIRRRPKTWSDSKERRENEKNRTLKRNRGRFYKSVEQNSHEIFSS